MTLTGSSLPPLAKGGIDWLTSLGTDRRYNCCVINHRAGCRLNLFASGRKNKSCRERCFNYMPGVERPWMLLCCVRLTLIEFSLLLQPHSLLFSYTHTHTHTHTVQLVTQGLAWLVRWALRICNLKSRLAQWQCNISVTLQDMWSLESLRVEGREGEREIIQPCNFDLTYWCVRQSCTLQAGRR